MTIYGNTYRNSDQGIQLWGIVISDPVTNIPLYYTTLRNVTVVGCEPLTFGPENEGWMGLSEPVANAVPEAVAIVEQLLSRLVPTGSAPDA